MHSRNNKQTNFIASYEHQNQKFHSLQLYRYTRHASYFHDLPKSKPFLGSQFTIFTVFIAFNTANFPLLISCFSMFTVICPRSTRFSPFFVFVAHDVIASLFCTSKGDRWVSLPSHSHLNLSLLQLLSGQTFLLTAFFHNFFLFCDTSFNDLLPDLARFHHRHEQNRTCSVKFWAETCNSPFSL